MQPGAFFREPRQFELLAQGVLAGGPRPRNRRIRLWSAGCGTGEEAWSIAMVVAEAELPDALAVDIVATDGDAGALAHATDAVYGDAAMQRISSPRRRRHFVRGVGRRQGLWRVVAPLRDCVELAQLDLGGAWPAGARFDAVFCDAPIAALGPRDAHWLARRFADVLAPGGMLFLGRAPGAAEDIPGLALCAPGIYRRLAR